MTERIKKPDEDQLISYIKIMERDKLNILVSRVFFISPSLMAVNRFKNHIFIDVNHRFIRFTGYSREEIVGRSIQELNILRREQYDRICQSLKAQNAIYSEEVEYRMKSGEIRAAIYSAELFDVQDEKFVLSVYHDITERRHVQKTLKQREKELTQRLVELEEAKTALRVFSERLEEDRNNLEAVLHQNINELVFPYIRELRNHNLDERSKCYLNIIELNLKDIISPFLNNISLDYRNLTPTEIQVASMIRAGMMSKEIANLLGVAVGTVDTHRNNIRKKLGLKKEKTNLRSYLMSIS